MPSDTFYDLPNLSELMMDYNEISTLHPDTFINNPNLKYIKLAHNNLRVLTAGIFRNNQQLEAINLRDNNFVDIQVDFRNMKKLVYVNLDSRLPSDGSSVCKMRFSESTESTIDEFQENVEQFCRKLDEN